MAHGSAEHPAPEEGRRVTPQEQELEEQAKEGYFDAELRVRYLTNRGHSRRRLLRWLAAGSALLGSTAFINLLAQGPEPLALSAAGAAAFLSALSLAFGQDSREETHWL